jgi:hypothetical protein
MLPCAAFVAAGYGQHRGRRAARAALALLGGFLTVELTFLLIMKHAGALGAFWFNYWTYNTRYFLPAIPISRRILDALTLQMRYPGRHAHLLVLLIAGLVWSARRWRQSESRWTSSQLMPFVPFVWALSSYIGAMWSGRASGHYFIQFLPAAAWAGGNMIYSCAPWFRRRSPQRGRLYRWPGSQVWAVLCTVVLLVPLVAPQSTARYLANRLIGRVGLHRDMVGAEEVAHCGMLDWR